MERRRQNLWLWGGWLVFFGLIFVPSIWVLDQTIGEEIGYLIWGLSKFSLPSEVGLVLFKRSLALGAGASALALVLGTATGYLTTRADFPGRRLLFVLLLLPFFVPAYSYATAWVEWLAPGTVPMDTEASPSPVYSLGAAILLLVFYLFPWVHLVAGAGFASIERHLEDAARLTLPDGRRFRRVSLALVAGILASAGLYVFVFGLKNQSVAELLRQRVYATEIMTEYQAFLDDRQAALKGLVFVGVSLAALGLALWVALRRQRLAIEGLSSPWTGAEGAARRAGLLAPAVCLLVFGVTVVLPLAILLRTAGGWANYRLVLETARSQIVMGLLTSAAAATLAVVMGFFLAEHIQRSGRLGAALTVVAAFVLFALPAPVLDIGLIRFWNRPGPLGWVYDRPAVLVLGQTAAFLPIAVVGFWVALRRIDPRLIEAAELAGLRWPTVALRILGPILRPWFVGLWAVVFVLALNDIEAAVLLAPPGGDTLSVRIMTMLHYMPDSQVSALCVVQVAMTTLAIGVVAALVFLGKTTGRLFAALSKGA